MIMTIKINGVEIDVRGEYDPGDLGTDAAPPTRPSFEPQTYWYNGADVTRLLQAIDWWNDIDAAINQKLGQWVELVK